VKTYSTKPSHVKSEWRVFDATDKVLGRLATEVSFLLQGKHKPLYARHILTGDYVIVVNVSKIRVTGKKLEQKMYRRHSHYPGGLRETRMSDLLERHPDRILRAAVRGMLPKTTLGRQMLRRLKVYPGDSHPHGAQVTAWASGEVLVPRLQLDRPVQDSESVIEKPVELLTETPAEDSATVTEQPTDNPAEQSAEDNATVVEQPTDNPAEQSAEDSATVIEQPTDNPAKQSADDSATEPQKESTGQKTGEK